MTSVWPSTAAHYCAVRTANTLTAYMTAYGAPSGGLGKGMTAYMTAYGAPSRQGKGMTAYMTAYMTTYLTAYGAPSGLGKGMKGKVKLG